MRDCSNLMVLISPLFTLIITLKLKQTFCVFFSLQINELVDCRDVSIGAWFEASIENVTLTPTKGKVGRPPKRTILKAEPEQTQAQDLSKDTCRTSAVLNTESNGASTSQTDSSPTGNKGREENVIYHIKYEE